MKAKFFPFKHVYSIDKGCLFEVRLPKIEYRYASLWYDKDRSWYWHMPSSWSDKELLALRIYECDLTKDRIFWDCTQNFATDKINWQWIDL